MSKSNTLEGKPKSLARESVKVKRARRRIALLLNEESARVTPEALSIERKKIQRRLEEDNERIEVPEVETSELDLDVVN